MTKRYSLSIAQGTAEEAWIWGDSISGLMSDIKRWLALGYSVTLTDHRLNIEYEYVTKISNKQPEIN